MNAPPMRKFRYVCKHCKVPVIGKFDFRPILGRTHGKKCPRKKLG